MSDFDLEAIRARAKELGVAYHPAQKAETIQFNIDTFLAEKQETAAVEALKVAEVKAPAEAKVEGPAELLERIQKEALALIPVTITSMDPADAKLSAVVVSVGNAVLGQITKAIPFGYKWYMPKILIDELETVMFIRNEMVATPGAPGGEKLNTQWIKKYAIQYHPMPTPDDLTALAKAQAVGNELAK